MADKCTGALYAGLTTCKTVVKSYETVILSYDTVLSGMAVPAGGSCLSNRACHWKLGINCVACPVKVLQYFHFAAFTLATVTNVIDMLLLHTIAAGRVAGDRQQDGSL